MNVFRGSLVGTILLGLCAPLLAQVSLAKEGDKPYTPSRLEWFALELNAKFHEQLSYERGFSIDFVPLPGKDTILIVVYYLPTVRRELMNLAIANDRKVIDIETTNRGWSWLRVKEQVEMSQLPEK